MDTVAQAGKPRGDDEVHTGDAGERIETGN
jgi:hypothetical protein